MGFNYIVTLKKKACGSKNDQLDPVLDVDVKLTTPHEHEVKSMTASAIFALFLFNTLFYLCMREGHNLLMVDLLEAIVIVIVFDIFVTFIL